MARRPLGLVGGLLGKLRIMLGAGNELVKRGTQRDKLEREC